MALSDSASRSIPKKTSKLNVYGVVVYIANSIRNTLLSRNQTFKKAFDTYDNPRHLNVVSDFHTLSFHKLKQPSKMVIEYSLPRTSFISSLSSQIKH